MAEKITTNGDKPLSVSLLKQMFLTDFAEM